VARRGFRVVKQKAEEVNHHKGDSSKVKTGTTEIRVILTPHTVCLYVPRKGTRIEVYLIGRDGLKLIKEFGLYGEIACLEPFRPVVCLIQHH